MKRRCDFDVVEYLYTAFILRVHENAHNRAEFVAEFVVKPRDAEPVIRSARQRDVPADSEPQRVTDESRVILADSSRTEDAPSFLGIVIGLQVLEALPEQAPSLVRCLDHKLRENDSRILTDSDLFPVVPGKPECLNTRLLAKRSRQPDSPQQRYSVFKQLIEATLRDGVVGIENIESQERQFVLEDRDTGSERRIRHAGNGDGWKHGAHVHKRVVPAPSREWRKALRKRIHLAEGNRDVLGQELCEEHLGEH